MEAVGGKPKVLADTRYSRGPSIVPVPGIVPVKSPDTDSALNSAGVPVKSLDTDSALNSAGPALLREAPL